jgi:hypothetical protein
MATTTNYSWTTPDDTALVKDGAAAIRTLGSSVDTTVKNLNPETTTGAISYRGATANQKVALPIGTAGQVLKVNSGATAPEWGTVSTNPTTGDGEVTTAQTSTSATYTDLATAGPSCTVTTGTKALVILTADFNTNTVNSRNYMSYAVSGATTISASDNFAISCLPWRINEDMTQTMIHVVTLTAGSNTFTAKYRVSANTGKWTNRRIFVMNLN